MSKTSKILKKKTDKDLKESAYKVELAEDFIDFLQKHPRASQDEIENVEQLKKTWENDLRKLMGFVELIK